MRRPDSRLWLLLPIAFLLAMFVVPALAGVGGSSFNDSPPNASATVTGLVTAGTQTLGGAKTFDAAITSGATSGNNALILAQGAILRFAGAAGGSYLSASGAGILLSNQGFAAGQAGFDLGTNDANRWQNIYAVNATLTADLTVSGNTTLGDATTDTVTINGATTFAANTNVTMASGTGVFVQTHAPTTDATADALTMTLSAGGTGESGTLRGFVISQSDTTTTGAYDRLLVVDNLKTPETTTSGIFIRQNAASATMSAAVQVNTPAGTITDAILIGETGGTITTGVNINSEIVTCISIANAPTTAILDTPSIDITGAGAITGATGITNDGNTTLGNATTDTLTITAGIAADVQFDAGATRTVNVEAQPASATPSTGSALSCAGGAGGAGSGTNISGGAGGAATYTAGVGGVATGTGTGGVGGTTNVTSANGGASAGASGTAGAGGAITIVAGNGGATNGGTGAAGGAVNINGGDATGGATDGAVNVGTGATTSAVGIGATGITTTNNGALTCTQTLTANGNSTIGDAEADTATVNAITDFVSIARETTGANVASGTAITLGNDGNLFTVTGTTTVTTTVAKPAGTRVCIIFSGTLTFTDDDTPGADKMRLAGNFSTTANDTICMVSDGTNWFEISRSVN